VLAEELVRATAPGAVSTVALLDFDNFKTYNDEHGHLAGDDLLIQATSNWKAQLRDIDVLARWGGEEFVILLPGTPLADGGRVLDRLRATMPAGQTFSAGLVELKGTQATPILRAADVALYRAKAEGRARNAFGEVHVDPIDADPGPAPAFPPEPPAVVRPSAAASAAARARRVVRPGVAGLATP
jgi:diguanylate cyclase (GGDEF)-like protein